jgi:hypothetical protein
VGALMMTFMVVGSPLKTVGVFCRIEIFGAKNLSENFHATLIYQFRTSLFVGWVASRKKHLGFWERFAIDSN